MKITNYGWSTSVGRRGWEGGQAYHPPAFPHAKPVGVQVKD